MLRQLVAALLFLLPSLAFGAANIEVKIDGMTCAGCVEAVTRKLEQVPNVDKASIKVVLKENTARLSVVSADEQTFKAIKKAVTSAGYKVVGEIKVN